MPQRKTKNTTTPQRTAKGKRKTREQAAHVKAATSSRQGVTRNEPQPQPRHAQRDASHYKGVNDVQPVFVTRSIIGPDGRARSAWEMWVGDLMFGRAETKEALLEYYTRLHEPIPSGHWRDRPWQAHSKKRTQQQPREDETPPFEDDATPTLNEDFDESWAE